MFPYFYIFGRPIAMYGVCMMVGLFLSAILAIRRGKKFGICADDIILVAAIAFGAAILCGAILYVFVTYPLDTILYLIKTGQMKGQNFGIVFYGGLIGGVLGAWIGAKMAKVRISDIVPVVVPFIPLGHGIGRIGCLMAGCCHGMEYDGFLAVYYPNSLAGLPPDQGYFPVQALECILNLVICGVLLCFAKRIKRNMDLLYAYLALYAVSRFGLEFLRGDEVRGIFLHLSTSQWISIGLLLVGIFGIFLPRTQKKDNV